MQNPICKPGGKPVQLTDGNRTGYNLWVNLKKEFGQGDSMYTLKDVAARAGVSPTIVSYVLNNSNYVSAEKRAAVLKAVKELNYHINCNARGLRKKKPPTSPSSPLMSGQSFIPRSSTIWSSLPTEKASLFPFHRSIRSKRQIPT